MAGLTSCRREACTTALQTYTPTQQPHTHTHAVTRGQSQHTMLLFPHAYIHAQSLVMVSSSSLLFSVLPFVACGGEGGWVVTLTQICHIASQHHSNHLNSLLNILSAEFHTQTTCNVFLFFAMNRIQQHMLGISMCFFQRCTGSALMSSLTQLQTMIRFH